jgi:uncharacterized pyridoxal phosphate-containing UPF0001 family protein
MKRFICTFLFDIMPVQRNSYLSLISELQSKNVTLVAVSKIKPIEDIKE